MNRKADEDLDRLKRETFQALLKNAKEEQHVTKVMHRLIRHFRKFHQFQELRKFKHQASLVAQIIDKDKINGAYLLLKRFKERLKAFDAALRAVDSAKANIADFEELKASLDMTRSTTMFNDMKQLFDTAAKNFDKKLAHERATMTAMFERILNNERLTQVAIENKYN